MSAVHSIVCFKVVPKPEEVTINPETMTLDRARARQEFNPSDMNALEVALDLKDRHGGTVSLIAMGPPLFEEYLRVALAVGADAAYLLSDRAFGGADTLATSYAMAKGIEKISNYDIILCGEESSDGATGQVPPGIAEWLDIPQITYATELDIVDGKVKARREIKGGHEVLIAPTPCVASVKAGVNELRFIDMSRRAWSKREAPVTVWTVADLGIDPDMVGIKGSATVVAGVQQAATAERRREFIQGTPQQEALALLERLHRQLEPILHR